MYIHEALAVLLVLLGLASPLLIVGFFYYLQKRLEHRQILAAIEKGIPISQFVTPRRRPAGPAWISYLWVGIALLIVGVGFQISNEPERIIAFILGGVGAAWIVRGLVHRHYFLHEQARDTRS